VTVDFYFIVILQLWKAIPVVMPKEA